MDDHDRLWAEHRAAEARVVWPWLAALAVLTAVPALVFAVLLG